MEHTRKFVLVNADSLSRLGQSRTGSEAQASSLRQQMSDVLHDKGLSDERKLSRYQHYENQYFTERNALNEPVKLEMFDAGEEALSARGKPTDVITSAVAFLEQKFGSKAHALGEYLLSDYAKDLKWNRKGQLIANGRLIERSNIIALMTDVLTPRASRHPAGCFELSRVLQRAPFPLAFIQELTGVYKNPQFHRHGNFAAEDLGRPDQPWASFESQNLPFHYADYAGESSRGKGKGVGKKSARPVIQRRVDEANIISTLGGRTSRTQRGETSSVSSYGSVVDSEVNESERGMTSGEKTPGGASARLLDSLLTPETGEKTPPTVLKVISGASHVPASASISSTARTLFPSDSSSTVSQDQRRIKARANQIAQLRAQLELPADPRVLTGIRDRIQQLETEQTQDVETTARRQEENRRHWAQFMLGDQQQREQERGGREGGASGNDDDDNE